MKTSEFIEGVEKLDFYILGGYKINGIIGVAVNSSRRPFLEVDLNSFGDVIVKPENYQEFDVVIQGKVKRMINSGVELAFTPINKREDEPKFRVAIRPSYYKDMKYYYLDLLEAGYANETGKKLEPIADELGKEFTPTSYKDFLEDYPEWRPFLPDYDPDNTDVFIPVPVEENK